MSIMIKLDDKDNVATSLSSHKAYDDVIIVNKKRENIMSIKALEDIPFANKIALEDIKKDDDIIKYNEVIGYAIKDIEVGSLVHVHNVRSKILDIPNQIIEEIIKQMNIKK